MSDRICVRRDGWGAVPSSSARGRAGTRPASVSRSTTASIDSESLARVDGSRARSVVVHSDRTMPRFVGRSKVGGGEGVDRASRARPPVSRLPRQLEERARVGRRRVSLLRSPTFSFERDIVQLLCWLHQQVVEPVDFRHGVGESATSPHHGMEIVLMVGLEREEQRHDRVPRVGSPGAQDIATHLTLGAVERRHVDVQRRHRRPTPTVAEGCGVEDTHVTGESGNYQVLVDGGNGPCGHSVPGARQQFEPFAKAVLIEPFVSTRLRVGPQIEIEHRRQLLRCR